MPLDADITAELIDLAGSQAFGTRLLEVSASLSGVEEVFGYVTDSQGTRPLVSASALDRQDVRVQEYARRFYLQDPAIHDARHVDPHSGFWQLVRVGEIVPRDYRKICYEEPRFTAKLCFGWRSTNHTIALNFYTRRDDDSLTSPELTSLADIALAALNRRNLAHKDGDGLVTALEQRLAGAFPKLADRERQVISRSLSGWTAEAIAASLGTTRGTVLTYRQRAYQKFGFSNAAGFLSRLI